MSLDLDILKRNFTELHNSLGRSALHHLYPKDFEYYMIALELVNGSGSTIDYLAFPVLPASISKVENRRVNIKKAYKSTLVINSSTFVPQDITIRGNFGRSFKILVGNSVVLNGLAVSTRSGVYDLSQTVTGITTPSRVFSRSIKTGYGVTKILQSIINKSSGSDNNGPYRLYLYNYALGESYLVVPPSRALSLEQNEASNNMIWGYSLTLTIVSPLELVRSATSPNSLLKLATSNAIQNGVNMAAKSTLNFVHQYINKGYLSYKLG
jgi:hypothetical protein